MEPPSPTAAIGGARPIARPGNASKGIDQVGQGFGEQAEAARRNRFGSTLTPRRGQMGLPPQLPPGQTAAPTAAPRPAPRPVQRPVARPTTPVAPPVPPISEPPNPTLGIPAPQAPTFGPGNDLRFNTIAPQTSDRLKAAQGVTDSTAAAIQKYNPVTAVGQHAKTAQQFLTPGNVAFTGVESDVSRRTVDPNIGFTALDTGVSRRAVDPNLAFEQLDTNVSRRTVDPTLQFQELDTDVATGGSVMPGDTADLASFRAMRGDAASALTSGPSRSEIAKNALDAFDTRSLPGVQDQIRDVGRLAAARGRFGMGETIDETSAPYLKYMAERAALEKELAGETAAGEIADRQRILEAARGLVGEEESIASGRRGEERTERAYGTAVEESNIGRRIGERDRATDIARGNIDRDMSQAESEAALAERNVGRAVGERDRALDVSRGNIDRDIALADAETGLAERNVGRSISERDTALGLSERNLGRDIGLADTEMGLAERNVGRRTGERDAQLAVDTGNVNRQFDARRAALEAGMGMGDRERDFLLDRYGVATGAEGRISDEARTDRDELRGERGYQYDVSERATDRALQGRELENAEMEREFRRQMELEALRLGVDPTGTLLNASGRLGAESGESMAGAADLLGQWLANRRKQQAGAA